MARIRTIKPEFWTSEQVMECSPITRLMFIGIWNFADDAGRLPLSTKSIKAQIFPGDNFSPDEVRRMLDELSTIGLILVYAVDGKEYLQVTGWHHQKIDRPQPPKYPAPLLDHSSNDRRTLATEGKGEEGKGKERESKGSETDADARALSSIEDLKAGIAGAFSAANAGTVPDTSRAALWLSQGFDPAIVLAVVTDLVKRKPSISSLNYFDAAIRDAHRARAPARIEVGPEPPKDWDGQMQRFRRGFPWTAKHWGPEPGMGGCRVPREILARYGYVSGPKQEDAP